MSYAKHKFEVVSCWHYKSTTCFWMDGLFRDERAGKIREMRAIYSELELWSAKEKRDLCEPQEGYPTKR